MNSKKIYSGEITREKVIEGINLAASVIAKTLGPSGKAVAINVGSMVSDVPEISRDGATVAKSIVFSDQALNMGAQLIKKAASNVETKSGDGTSSTSILIKEFCERGQRAIKSGSNVNEVKAGMLKAGSWITDYIKKSATPIDNDLEKIKKIATISANNDPEVGDLIVECMKKVGIDGVITADLTADLETKIEVVEGMKLDRGWLSPQYVTKPEEGKCEMNEPYILITDEKISSMNQIMGILQSVMTSGRPFLIICGDIDDIVNTTFVYNTLSGAIRCCIVKGIDFGDSRKNIMQDIAVACGGTFICSDNNITLSEARIDCLGSAKKVVITQNSTIIFEGYGDKESIEKRLQIIKARLNDPNTSAYDKTKFEKRFAGLSGGIGVIKAGGAMESEKLNRKATIEDAILASKSSISEGCVPGGGYIYLKASKDMKNDSAFWKTLKGDEKIGAQIIMESLPVITKTVISNAGLVSSDVVITNILKSNKPNYGFNAKTSKYCDLVEDGILDSAKVLRVSMENAISTASMVLLIDALILNEDEPKNEEI